MTNTFTLYDYGDRRDPVASTPEKVATRKYADQIARLGLRYRAAQPYDPNLVIILPGGVTMPFDDWLKTIDAPTGIIAAFVEGEDHGTA